MGVIDEIKQKADILDIVGQYVALSKAGRTFRGLCPFHSEKHGSFFVYPEQNTWHCFGACSTGGDVFSFIMKKENMTFGEALRHLAQRTGVALPLKGEVESKGKEKERLYQINQEAARFFHEQLLESPLAERARAYVAMRGLLTKTVSSFELGFSPPGWETLKNYLTGIGYSENELTTVGLVLAGEDSRVHDRFRGKLMFPIFDGEGHVTGFGARALDDSEPKYINSPETPAFDKSSNLYGINLAATSIRQKNMIVITEGYMDVITAHQNGFTNVVAAMGTSVSDEQVGVIKRLTRNVVLAFDADNAGEEAMVRCTTLENALSSEVKVIKMSAGKDPDDVIREDPSTWQRLLTEAQPLMDCIFSMVIAPLDLTKAKDKTLVVDRLIPVIADMKDVVRQAHYLEKLARLVKVNERQLETALSKNRPRRANATAASPKPEGVSHTTVLFSSPLEEYCLALLLKHPELKKQCHDLKSEYFENTENREIYNAWQQAGDREVKDVLAPEIWERLESLMNGSLITTHIEQRFKGCVLRLRENCLRHREIEKEALLAMEAESSGTAGEIAKLEEQGIEESQELKRIFLEKARRRVEQRR